MRIALLAAVLPLALAACATEPQYPVRPGEPRVGVELPKPTYPIHEQSAPTLPATSPQQPAAIPSHPASDTPAPYKPQPILGSQDPQPDNLPPLRGRQPPGGSAAARQVPPPALETPREVTVRPGESLFEVAERVRTPIRAIIDLNGLKPPYEVTPGSTLKIPPPVVYTVKSGDTLMGVGRRFSIDPRSLANLNDIPLESPLSPGQRLALPSLVKDSEATPPSKAAIATAAPSRPSVPPPPPPSALSPLASSRSTKPATVAPTPAQGASQAEAEGSSPAAAAAAGKGKFAWPVKGDILSTYGPKGPGQRNDGVNIAAKEGEPVRAAASGVVVYAGNSVPGFGNLVVVKHPDGWTSLYGNLGKMSVKIRAEVSQGQELGLAGQSGAVDRPQVHFEVRYAASPQEKARPVDPQGVLP